MYTYLIYYIIACHAVFCMYILNINIFMLYEDINDVVSCHSFIIYH